MFQVNNASNSNVHYLKSAQIKRFSFSEKYGTEKTSYSYLVKNVRNNKNDARKFIGTSTNDNVMKKMFDGDKKVIRSSCLETD